MSQKSKISILVAAAAFGLSAISASVADQSANTEAKVLVVYKVSDPAMVQEYQSATGPILMEYGLRPDTVLQITKSYHGEAQDMAWLLNFPSQEKADAAFNDPRYKKWVDFRNKAFTKLSIFGVSQVNLNASTK